MVKASRRLVAPAAVTFVTALLVTVAAPALAAPGDPGEPADPAVVFSEDFENAPPGSNVLLHDYDSANDAITYSAEAPWASRASCNGLIVDWASTQTVDDSGTPVDCVGSDNAQAPGTTWFSLLQRLIYAQGVVAGMANPEENAGVASFTANPNPGVNKIQFQTNEDIAMASAGRFVTFSVDATAMSCQSTHPRLRFYVRDSAGTEHAVSDTAIDPCTGPAIAVPSKNGQSGAVHGARFVAPGALFVPGSTVGIVLRNENGSARGNDGAYDNIRLLDATPSLDKSFATRERPWITGEAVDLTFTVTNTSELAEKSGWSFVDDLPAGLELAGPATSTCATAEVTGDPGDTTIEVEDGSIAAGVESCTITVPVTATAAGEFSNGPGNVTTTGLDEPEAATVTFEAPDPRLSVEKEAELHDTNGNGTADQDETITYSFRAHNTGNLPLDDVMIVDQMLADAGVAVSPGPIDLAIDEDAEWTAQPYTVTADDVERGEVVNVATARGTDPGGRDVVSGEATTTTPATAPDVEGPGEDEEPGADEGEGAGAGSGGSGSGQPEAGGLPDAGAPFGVGLVAAGAAAVVLGGGLLLSRRARRPGRTA